LAGCLFFMDPPTAVFRRQAASSKPLYAASQSTGECSYQGRTRHKQKFVLRMHDRDRTSFRVVANKKIRQFLDGKIKMGRLKSRTLVQARQDKQIDHVRVESNQLHSATSEKQGSSPLTSRIPRRDVLANAFSASPISFETDK
jgi:hypothetical protein